MHMKIAIIGAGAMGCLFACLLDNYEVTLYDVSPVAVERINRDGILLQEPDGTESRHRIPIRFSGEGQEPQDLVILFVKDTAGEAALRANLGLVERLGADQASLLVGGEYALEGGVNDRIVIENSEHQSDGDTVVGTQGSAVSGEDAVLYDQVDTVGRKVVLNGAQLVAHHVDVAL